MITLTVRWLTALACALVLCLPNGADAQDLSRYRGIAFGSSVSAVATITGAGADSLTVIHRRPALIQELAWRPQYAANRDLERTEPVREVVFRFHDDALFRVAVVYDSRLVEGLTGADVIDAVSRVYGPATLAAAASQVAARAPSGLMSETTVLARWHSPDHEFTLMRQVYPATYLFIGVARQLDAVARAAERAAVRLDKEEAPRREAEQRAADAARKKAAEDKTRTTNKGDFRP